MKLSELFKQGKFVITCEVGPPKGTDLEELKLKTFQMLDIFNGRSQSPQMMIMEEMVVVLEEEQHRQRPQE